MADLTKESIIGADDSPLLPLEVPEWGGTLYIRTLNGMERDWFEEQCVTISGIGKTATAKANMRNMRAKLAAMAIADKDGKRMFHETEIPKLAQKSGLALDRVFNAAKEHNKMLDVDKDIQDLEDGPSESSGTVSQ